MKYLILFLCLCGAMAHGQYAADPTPLTSDQQGESLKKINKILNDQRTGANPQTVIVSGGSSSSKTGAANVNMGQATAAASPVSIAARATRRGITVINTDASLTVYIGGTNTVNASTGLRLTPGQSVSIDTVAAIYVYAASGSPVVGYIETYD